MDKVHFWPFNCYAGLILTIQLQNQKSSTIELSKPFTFGHLAVLLSGFAFVVDTWWWAHMSGINFSLLFSFFSGGAAHHALLLHGLLRGRPRQEAAEGACYRQLEGRAEQHQLRSGLRQQRRWRDKQAAPSVVGASH